MIFASGPRSRVERPLSAARKASVEEPDTEEMVRRVRQAIQRENDPVQSLELLSRNTVCQPYTYLHSYTCPTSPQLRPLLIYSIFLHA